MCGRPHRETIRRGDPPREGETKMKRRLLLLPMSMLLVLTLFAAPAFAQTDAQIGALKHVS